MSLTSSDKKHSLSFSSTDFDKNSITVSNYVFLHEPDDAHLCQICLEVAEEPWQHGDCGRLYCKHCLFKYGRQKDCPNCRMAKPQYFPDNKSKREIKALHVKCRNLERGCKWKGTVGTVENHLETCKYHLLPCPKKCKNSRSKINQYMRKDLDKHLANECPNREYSCQYCGEDGTYAFIIQVHDDVCEYKVLPCINKDCTKKLQRQHIHKHVKYECEHTLTACKHACIGCNVSLKRKDMLVHEMDDKQHLHMAINTITAMKNNTEGMLKPREAKIFRFTDYQVRKESNKYFTSPFFYTSHGYHMAISVHAYGSKCGKGTHVSVYVPIRAGKYDSQVKWPLLGYVTIEALNQLEDKNHHKIAMPLKMAQDARVGSCWGQVQFIAHSKLGYDPVRNTQYLKDDTIYFRVAVDVDNDRPWLECAENM